MRSDQSIGEPFPENLIEGNIYRLLALKLHRELERRLTAVFGTTAQDPKVLTVSAALAALGRLPKPDEHQRKIQDALKVNQRRTTTLTESWA